jgi:predicted enzyme related to lactoylglutathione lyase
VPERTEYAPGTPNWIDLAAPDADEAEQFYGDLFGWESQDAPGDPEETGGYRFFMLNGKIVTGYGPPGPDEPPSWRCYVAVSDADETTAKAKEAGAEVLLEPLDVMGAGRIAVFRDPEGAVMCAWRPEQTPGVQIVNEPGSFCWSELQTRDLDGAKRFYSAIFGWDYEDNDLGETTYTGIRLDGRPIGGMLPMSEQVPDETPPHWLIYFATEDLDGASEKAADVVIPRMESPAGAFAILQDPGGANFAVIELSEEAKATGR